MKFKGNLKTSLVELVVSHVVLCRTAESYLVWWLQELNSYRSL